MLSSGLRVLEDRHFGPRVRIVVEPPVDANALGADGRDGVAAVVETRGLDDLGDRADVGAQITAADLAPPFDQDDAEALVAVETMLDESAVAILEHVERQDRRREQHRAQREHGHLGHDRFLP